MGELIWGTGSTPLLAELLTDRIPAESMRTRRFPQAAELYRPGDQARFVYVVRTGIVKEWLVSEAGREIIWALDGPNDVFGDLATAMPFPAPTRWCTATAVVATEVLELSAIDLRARLHVDHRLADAWMAAMACRLRDAAERQLQFGTLDATARVAACLCVLVERFGTGAGHDELVLPFPQHDLAAWAGVSREAVVRALRQLRRTGALTNAGRQFVVDPARLGQMTHGAGSAVAASA